MKDNTRVTPNPEATSLSAKSSIAPVQKKRKVSKDDVRSHAIRVLCPRKLGPDEDVNKLNWIQLEECSAIITPATTASDSKDIRAALIAITKCNPKRAAAALIKMLDNPSNSKVKLLIMDAMLTVDKATTQDAIIRQGLQDCISFHTDQQGGTRTTAAETLIRNVLTAAMFTAVKDPSLSM